MIKNVIQQVKSHLTAAKVNSIKSVHDSTVDPSDGFCSEVMMRLSELLRDLETEALCQLGQSRIRALPNQLDLCGLSHHRQAYLS